MPDPHTAPSPTTVTNTPLSSAPRVLVFDSGVGGLSVMQQITKLNPYIDIVYASDNAAFPYGTKTEAQLLPRVVAVMAALIERFAPDLVVIACNTASTLALAHLREHFSVPFVGVVPAIKPAASASQNKVIGLLATPATIRRDYTKTLIEHHAADCEIIKVGSSWLVELAEKKLRKAPVDMESLEAILTPFMLAPECDQLVLACTHFPLLREEIQSLLPSVNLVDSGEAIARRVQYLLDERDLIAPREAHYQAVFTLDSPQVQELIESLSDCGLRDIEFITVS